MVDVISTSPYDTDADMQLACAKTHGESIEIKIRGDQADRFPSGECQAPCQTKYSKLHCRTTNAEHY
jgi:hypothetical protein